MVTLKEVLNHVEHIVKENSMLLEVWQVQKDNTGQVNVRHKLSDSSYNVFEAFCFEDRVILSYVDANFKSALDHWLWVNLKQSVSN